METNAINVKDFFQGMERLYDSNLATSFEITKSFPTVALLSLIHI